jgi:hypothetical protein
LAPVITLSAPSAVRMSRSERYPATAILVIMRAECRAARTPQATRIHRTTNDRARDALHVRATVPARDGRHCWRAR